MKKLVLTTLAVAGISGAAFAQGYVNYAAGSASVVVSLNSSNYSTLSATLGANTPANAAGTVGLMPASTAGLYYFELLMSTVDTTTPTTLADLAANWTQAGTSALLWQNTAGANGRITTVGTPTAATQVLPASYTGATEVSFMLVGWSGNLGTTYAGTGNVLSELQAWPVAVTGTAYFGESTVAAINPVSTSSSAGSPIFGAGLIYNPSTTPMVLNALAAVPEPGTLALAALGGASLLMFRRKK